MNKLSQAVSPRISRPVRQTEKSSQYVAAVTAFKVALLWIGG